MNRKTGGKSEERAAGGDCRLAGREGPPPQPLALRAGPLTLVFDPETVFLRRICLGDREVIRGIYAAVRDRDWGTVPPRLATLESRIEADSFDLAFEADCRREEIHFRWRGRILGASDGTLSFDFDGEALTGFLRNRIGFCVLHPIRECAGARARLERADGARAALRFPSLIEPQIVGRASFRDLRALAHEVLPGLWAELRFEGDVFEMEDQRNWTDASFKTYCTPLELPFPAPVEPGTRIRQRVTLRFTDEGAAPCASPSACEIGSGPEAPQGADLTFPSAPAQALPKWGLGLASHGRTLTPRETQRLASLGLAHLRADLRLADAGRWRPALERLAEQAQSLGAGMELAVHLPSAEARTALRQLRENLQAQSANLARVLVFREGEPASTPETLRLARAELGCLGAPIGGGADAHFCELNREQALGRFGLAEAEFVAWPMTPQVHAFDDLSVMESLEAQPDALATARAFAGERPLVISPITLKPRFNAVATSPESAPAPEDFAALADPRQESLFASAWTLGSLAALTRAGAANVTLFETTGARGVMTAEDDVNHPGSRRPAPGAVFPVFCLLAAMAGFKRGAALETGPGRELAGLCLVGERGHLRVLLANLTARPQRARVRVEAVSARVRMLDAGTVEEAVRAPERLLADMPNAQPGADGCLTLLLQPYALAMADFTSCA